MNDHLSNGLPHGRHAASSGGVETIPIAIVGLSCRLPGEATSPEKLWQNCAEERDSWQPVPERMNHSASYHPDPNRRGTVS